MFLKSEKKHKMRILEHWLQRAWLSVAVSFSPPQSATTLQTVNLRKVGNPGF